MTTYPVRLHVERPDRSTRLQLLVRLVAFSALGVVGLSFGTVFLFAYLALPVFAAVRLSSRPAEAYLGGDGARIIRVLTWFAAISTWASLLTDRLPTAAPDETVRLEIHRSGEPTSSSAMWRVFSGWPSALVLVALCWFGTFVWFWAALTILVRGRIGTGTHNYLLGVQRWSFRLLAFQASLVDEYPPFSFDDSTPPALPSARVVP
jgi:hypothetical protein